MSNTITNTDDIIDIREVIERVEELREQRKPRYVVGWNTPGFMPDSTPEEFDDADDARAYIAEKMRERADEFEEGAQSVNDDANALHLREAAEFVLDLLNTENAEADFGQTIADLHYWITYDGTMGLDEEETEELALLEALLEECKGNGGDEKWEGDWYPLTLISETHFETYMDEMLEDIGELPKDLPSYLSITVDYDALKMDYTYIEYDGVTYYFR